MYFLCGIIFIPGGPTETLHRILCRGQSRQFHPQHHQPRLVGLLPSAIRGGVCQGRARRRRGVRRHVFVFRSQWGAQLRQQLFAQYRGAAALGASRRRHLDGLWGDFGYD